MGSRLLSDPVMSMLKIYNDFLYLMVGLARLELATPSLSGTYSNHLSYKPKKTTVKKNKDEKESNNNLTGMCHSKSI